MVKNFIFKLPYNYCDMTCNWEVILRRGWGYFSHLSSYSICLINPEKGKKKKRNKRNNDNGDN